VPTLSHAGGAHGIHPSELSPLARFPERYRLDEPTYRSSCHSSRRRAPDRPDRPRFLGFDPYESPWRLIAGLGRQPLAAPLGFSPSRVHSQQPCPGLFNPRSSHALLQTRPKTNSPAPQSLNQLLPGPTRPPWQATTNRPDNPLRVSHQYAPQHSSKPVVRAMCSPLAAPYVAIDWPTIFERHTLTLP
jgi:hypothetical protein